MTFKQFIGSSDTGIVGIINTVIVPVIFALAFLVFIWGLFKFVRDAGDETKRAEGRQFILWGLLGLVLLFSVWGFVNLLLSTLGIMPTSGSTTADSTFMSSFPTSGTTVGGAGGTGSNVFNANGLLLGKVNSSGNIVNSSGQVVGKIVNGHAVTPSGILITGATTWNQIDSGSAQSSGIQAGASVSSTSSPQKPELYIGRDQFIFIPVNWDQTKGDFNIFASAAMQEFKKQYLEVNKRAFPLLDSDETYFNSVFEAVNATDCINTCRMESLPTMLDLEILCTNQCLDKKRLYDPIPTFIGLSNDEKFFGVNFQEYLNIVVDLRNIENVSSAVHEIGHLFWSLCDEYKYSVWQQQNRDWSDYKGVSGCPNPYPLTCADHPQWVKNKDGYLTYVHELGLTWGGYKQTAIDEKNEKEAGTALCPGAVCIPSEGYGQCRSVMGPAFAPDDILYFFGGELETKIPIEALQQS